MNILILGSGGREHTLAWKLSQSSKCEKIFVAPGNAGTSSVAINVPIDPLDFPALGDFSLENKIDLIIIGPEVPLVEGVVDFFRNNPALQSIKMLGPDKKGAMLEGSKDFSKEFMYKYGIPTASSKTFTITNLNEGIEYLENHSLPVVLKADGLAAGKGVIIAETKLIAQDSLREMLQDKKFGSASSKVVVEEYLNGIELSVFILTDGKNYVVLPEAKDYKRIGENDKGPNTGGMGAVSPVIFADDLFHQKIKAQIIDPTIVGLAKEGIDYVGFIFFGLMNVEGNPYVIEYNARLGDPETEAIIPRIESDFLELCIAAVDRQLENKKIIIKPETAVTIMLVAGGYPDNYNKGDEITGFNKITDGMIYHAGTKLLNGKVVTNGGRVLAITCLGNNLNEALKKANTAASCIDWENRYYRKDIGLDLTRLK